MNKVEAIAAFALLHANQNGREELSALDLLTGIYVVSAENLFRRFSAAEFDADQAVQKICSLNEPLWFIRMRYFSEIFLGDTGMLAAAKASDELYTLLRSSGLKDSADPVNDLLVMLCRSHPDIYEQLSKAGFALK